MNAVLKPKLCKAKSCGKEFTPWRMGQRGCSMKCALEISRANVDRKLARIARIEKRDGRIRLMTRRDHMALTQKAFNAWIRERDKNRPCISCGTNSTSDSLTGGGWDCSHYRSIGANPELRFEELNAHKSCKRCNRDMSGNIVNYRIRLMARIGQEGVEFLEGPHEPKKYTILELKLIRAECVRKRKNSLLAALA